MELSNVYSIRDMYGDGALVKPHSPPLICVLREGSKCEDLCVVDSVFLL